MFRKMPNRASSADVMERSEDGMRVCGNEGTIVGAGGGIVFTGGVSIVLGLFGGEGRTLLLSLFRGLCSFSLVQHLRFRVS